MQRHHSPWCERTRNGCLRFSLNTSARQEYSNHCSSMTVECKRRHTPVLGSARVLKFLQILMHMSTCQQPTCSVQCNRVRMVTRHFVACGHCKMCRQFFSAIYFHVKSCKNGSCKVSLRSWVGLRNFF